MIFYHEDVHMISSSKAFARCLQWTVFSTIFCPRARDSPGDALSGIWDKNPLRWWASGEHISLLATPTKQVKKPPTELAPFLTSWQTVLRQEITRHWRDMAKYCWNAATLNNSVLAFGLRFLCLILHLCFFFPPLGSLASTHSGSGSLVVSSLASWPPSPSRLKAPILSVF